MIKLILMSLTTYKHSHNSYKLFFYPAGSASWQSQTCQPGYFSSETSALDTAHSYANYLIIILVYAIEVIAGLIVTLNIIFHCHKYGEFCI